MKVNILNTNVEKNLHKYIPSEHRQEQLRAPMKIHEV